MSTAQDSIRSIKSGRGANVALWVVQLLLAAAFLMAGASKLAGAEPMVKLFEALGLGQWFRYLTGALEVFAAVLLVVPRWSGFGALLLIPIMLGAAAAHLVVLKNSPAAPLVLLALAAVVAWGRLVREPFATKASY
ncbi:MAG TPA: DoxX family protein [Isosphaeraceae bacterium]|nr:DoxX family protein [Isosphaeraceae bacterium]